MAGSMSPQRSPHLVGTSSHASCSARRSTSPSSSATPPGSRMRYARHCRGVGDAVRALGHDLVPTAEFDSNVGHEHAIELIDGGPAAGGSLQAATGPPREGPAAVSGPRAWL